MPTAFPAPGPMDPSLEVLVALMPVLVGSAVLVQLAFLWVFKKR